MEPLDLLVIVPDLRSGGLTKHSDLLISEARRRGMSCRALVVTPGADADPQSLGGEWFDATELAQGELLGLLGATRHALLQAAPSTLPVLSLAGACQSVAVAVHGSPGSNRSWWGDAAWSVLRSCADGGDLRVLVPAENYRTGVAEELGIELGRVSVAPNATERVGQPSPSWPSTQTVAVPMRLAEDKRWVLAAAIELARVADTEIRLVGTGPHKDSLVSLLRSSNVRFEVVETADLAPALNTADVVVGVGLTALEAAARGRRVAVAHKEAPGRFAGVMATSSWQQLRAGNCAGIGQTGSVDARTAWRELLALSEGDLDALAALVKDDAGPASLLDAVLSAKGRLTSAPGLIEEALVRRSIAVAKELVQYDGWLHQLTEEQRRSREESAARLEALSTQNSAMQDSFSALQEAKSTSDSVADELYRQTRELLQSTSWRVTAPIRAIGAVRRYVPALRSQVNRRRLLAAADLLKRGEFRVLWQRLRMNATASTRHARAVQRPVVSRVAEAWPQELPLVSVVIPCFNYGRYIHDAIDSVLGQTLGDRVELIVVDGGSTDLETQETLRSLEAAPPPRTRVYLREDGRRHLVGDNRNFGIERANGKYICCLDADDKLDPRYLEVATFLAERYGYDLVSTTTKCFEKSSDRFGLVPEPDLADMLLANNVTTVAVFKRDFWVRSGGYVDSGLGESHIHEDWRLWVRMVALGARVYNITQSDLFYYRVHSRESLSNHQGVKGRAWQRDAVQEANADVVTPDALARSARARTVEIVVEGVTESPACDDGRPGVLLCMPFLVIGGAERLLSGVVAHLTSQGFRVVIVTTLEPPTGAGDSSGWFKNATEEIFHLPKLLEPHRWSDFMLHLIRAKGIDIVLLAGSSFAYQQLPQLRDAFPRLRVADLLFNAVGHVENNRKFSKLIDLHLCENAEVERWLLTSGEDRHRVVRIASGVDLERYRPRARDRGLPLLVGFSGRFSEEKDPLAFIEIAQRARHPDLHFVMTGAGPMESELRRAVERSNGAVDFLGRVENVEAHIARLDVLVVPSRLDGRPLVVLEALAMGVPVLASSVGGLPQLVMDGVTGWTKAPGDIEAFADQLLDLVHDPTVLADMGRSCRRFAETALDGAEMNRQYEDALRGLIRTSSVPQSGDEDGDMAWGLR